MTVIFSFIVFEIESPSFDTFTTFVTLFFYFDILTNFNTAFPDITGELITNRKEIISNYLRSWFVVDFVSNLPLDWIVKLAGR